MDLIHEILQTLRNNKLRTALTGLSVSWGIFMLIVLLGASKGVVNDFKEESSSAFSKSITIFNGYTAKPYKGYKEGRYIQMTDNDIDVIKTDNKNISDIVSDYQGNDQISSAIDQVSGFTAVFPKTLESERVTMKSGRFINGKDIEEKRRSIVLHEEYARRLFRTEEAALGSSVKMMGLAWTVVGIFSHPWQRTNYIPYTTYKFITGNDHKTSRLTAFVDGLENETDCKATEDGIRTSLAHAHEFAPDDPNAVWIWNRVAGYLRGRTANTVLDIVVWVIGLFTLLTGIVGVSNIMFVSVRERVHEIGIRRAIGAKPRNVLTQVLAESVAITSLFGYIGIVMGMIALKIVDSLTQNVRGFSNPNVDLSMALEVMVVLVIAGMIAGIFPALKAIKVKPVEALRDE